MDKKKSLFWIIWTKVKWSLLLEVGYSVTDTNVKNYISRNDMKIDECIGFLYSDEQYKQEISNVIVVHKNGRGQSRTIQGAIDLVLQNNN